MLPERLSNGICSLNPRVERLTFSCEIEIDRSGRFVNRKIYKSVIRTKERMTYTERATPSSAAPRRRSSQSSATAISSPISSGCTRCTRSCASGASSAARSTSTSPRPRSCSTRAGDDRGHPRDASATSPTASSKSSCSPRTRSWPRELVLRQSAGHLPRPPAARPAEARRPAGDPQGVQAQAARRRRGHPARRAAARDEGGARARPRSAS